MFGQKAIEVLDYYVYDLFDPAEPAWPFCLGKGWSNRVSITWPALRSLYETT